MKQRLYADFFMHFDITFMILLNIIIIVASLVWEFSIGTIIIYFIGMIIFAVSEYFIHRFLFHLKTPKNPFFLKLLKRLHYDHHSNPTDLFLLFLPIWYSIPNFLILSFIFYLISASYPFTLAFAGGLITMLLVYEWKHYIAHRPIKPMTAYGRYIKKHHLLHHFKNENYWFGVSTPVMDIIFDTLKDEKSVETSKTAKDLEKR